MKYRHCIILLLISVAGLFFNVVSAGDTITDNLDSARHCIMSQNYPRALNLVRMAEERDHGNAEALHLECSIMQTEILDYESYCINGQHYLLHANSILNRLKTLLPSMHGGDSLKGLFYLGSIMGGICVVKAKNDNVPIAFTKGLSSIAYFKQVLSRDSNFIAAYYGLGVFNYYVSQNLYRLPYFNKRYTN